MANTANTDLDLSLIETDDHDQLLAKINSYYQQDTSSKAQLSRNWERNQLMLDGKQWIVFDGEAIAGGIWRRLSVSKQNEYIPRPTTNYIYSIYQTLKSYLLKNKPRSSVRPNTTDFTDKSAAKIATLCLEANWVRLKEQYNYETAAANLLTYGTVYKKSYWDTSSVSFIKVPKMQSVPVTDPMTGEQIGEDLQPEVDPITHQPLFEQLPLGDVNTCIVEPFRITQDPLAMHLHEVRWVMEYSIQPLEWIKENFDKDEEGYTGRAALVEPEADLNGSMRRFFSLRTSAGVKDGFAAGGAGIASSDVMIENAAVVKEYYERPSYNYPQGRLIVCAGDQVVFSGDSPYEGPEMGDWHPYSECRWEIVPGRFHGKSPLDDAVEIQKNINSIDSVIILTRKTSATPQKLIPMGSAVSPGDWTGRPNQQIYYRPDGSGAKPETIPASGVDPTVFQERAQRVQDLKDVSAANDILKGDSPPGVGAASALNLLWEIGTGKLAPILDRWKMFVESDQKKQLRIISKFYKEPRPDYIRMLRSLNTELSEDAINNFIGKDLLDNCNVIVEAGSNIPKLQAAKQGMLMELAQMGELNLQNPANRVQFQQDMGITGYDADVEPDRTRAQWENDLLDNIKYTPDNKPVVLAIDNHEIHIAEHTTRMKAPNFMSLDFATQQAYMAHVQQHEDMQAKAMQAQMLQQKAMGPGPGQAPPQQQPAGVGPSKGKGMTKDMKNAVMGADLPKLN